ncbi:MAG: BC1872 family protein, partial [Anaerolineales bacterium]
PHYSTDIAAAWQVVDAMGERFRLLVINRIYPSGHYRATFILFGQDPAAHMMAPDPAWFVWEQTAPLAICRAALLATLPQDASPR